MFRALPPYHFKGDDSEIGPHPDCLGDIYLGNFHEYELWWRPAELPPTNYKYDRDLYPTKTDIVRLRCGPRPGYEKDRTWTWTLDVVHYPDQSLKPAQYPAFQELVRRLDALCPQHRKELYLQAKFRLDFMVVA